MYFLLHASCFMIHDLLIQILIFCQMSNASCVCIYYIHACMWNVELGTRAHTIIIITITWAHLTSLNCDLDLEACCRSKWSMLNANCGELRLHLSLSTPRSISFCQHGARLHCAIAIFYPFQNLLPFLCLQVVKAFTAEHSVSQLLQRQRQRAG